MSGNVVNFPYVPRLPLEARLLVPRAGVWFFLVCPSDMALFPDVLRPRDVGFVLTRLERVEEELFLPQPLPGDVHFIASPSDVRSAIGEFPLVTFSRANFNRDLAGAPTGSALEPAINGKLRCLDEHPGYSLCGKRGDTLYTLGERCAGHEYIGALPFPSRHAYAWWLLEVANLFRQFEIFDEVDRHLNGSADR